MARSKVSVEGSKRLERALEDLADDMQRAASRGATLAAEDIASDWRAHVPVDTGEYRASIESDEESAFSNDPKAPFVEFGTSTHVAHPDLRAAAERARKRMPDRVADEIKGELP